MWNAEVENRHLNLWHPGHNGCDSKWVMKDEVLLVLQSSADNPVCVPSSRLNFASLPV